MRVALLLAGLLAAVALAGCIDTGPGTTETVHEDFEDGIDAWAQRSDVPDDPNRPGHEVAWNITPAQGPSHDGAWSVAFHLDGSQDDGTIWIERPFQVEANQSYHVNATVWAHSMEESFNERGHLVVYMGHDPPETEEDFPAPGERTNATEPPPAGGLRAPLDQAEGWRAYGFEWVLPAAEERQDRALYIAVGISAVWETPLEYHLDALTIELTRQG